MHAILSVCGGPVYQLIRNLVAPGKPSDKSFSELVTLVRTHFCPFPSVTHSKKRRKSYFDFTSDLFFHICTKMLTVLIQI